MQQPEDSGGEPAAAGMPDPEALERALRFIDYRPRSTGETRARLRKWGYDDETAGVVTAYLETAGILDDLEFSRLFMNELIRKGLGRFRVRSELLKKKIDRETVEEVMSGYPEDEEIERATDAGEKRYGQLGETDGAQAHRKICSYLVRRGYSRQVSESAFRRIAQVDTESGAELE